MALNDHDPEQRKNLFRLLFVDRRTCTGQIVVENHGVLYYIEECKMKGMNLCNMN